MIEEYLTMLYKIYCTARVSVQVIEECLTNTHAPTHTLYKMKLLDVFEVKRFAEMHDFVNHGNR